MHRTGSKATKIFLAAAAGAIWLAGFGTARAGGAGADSGNFQKALDGVCAEFSISPCPKLPTINQLVIENAALSQENPASIRSSTDAAVDAGTEAFLDGSALSNPLAFVKPPSKTGLPIATLPGNPAATAFLSATTGSDPSTGLPATLNLTFDFKSRTKSAFTLNQDIGDLTLPFAVTDGNNNLPPGTTLEQLPRELTVQIRGAGGTGFTTAASGDLEGTGTPQSYSLDKLGISLALDFSGGNEVVDLGIPLIGIGNLLDFSAPGFLFDAANGLFDGIDPIAEFLDASFADDSGDLVHAFHADLAIAFDGSTVLSDPLPAPEPPALVLIGGALLALALVRRRSRG